LKTDYIMYYAADLLSISTASKYINEDGQNEIHLTIIFNTFVFLQIFNEINARRVNNEWNVFEHIFDNGYFIIIMGIIIGVQIIIVELGSDFTSTVKLNGKEWLYCILMGFSSIIINQFIRLIPINENDGIIEIDPNTFRRDSKF